MKRIRRIIETIQTKGLGFFLNKIINYLFNVKIPRYKLIKQLFQQKYGLEVGGPSGVFKDKGFIPLYKVVKGLDGCNFANSTIWEGNIKSGLSFQYHKNKVGIQYISEATDLKEIPSFYYDFVLSSNCLEHVANPLKAVKEWIRVIKKDGILLLVLPNKEYCFDHNRSYTSFSHILSDYQKDIQEDDMTHLEEILQYHDLKMDKGGGNINQFTERSLHNFQNRALHHHVFDIPILKEMFTYFKLEILYVHKGKEYSIVGKKTV